jgi:hypothetical protein
MRASLRRRAPGPQPQVRALPRGWRHHEGSHLVDSCSKALRRLVAKARLSSTMRAYCNERL